MNALVEELSMEEAWRGRAWRMVEKVSGVGKRTWAGLLKGVRDGGRGELLDGGRGEFRAPVMAEGQEVFRFDDGFQGRLKHCRDMKGMERLLRKTWNGLGMGHRNQLECSDKEFSGEVAWNFGCQHEVNFSGPGDLGLSSAAGIYMGCGSGLPRGT